MANVLMIVAQDKFRDEELFETRAAIEAAGHSVTLASQSPGLCTGTKNGTATASVSIDSVDTRRFEAVVFVGGPGARTLFTNHSAHRIAREANHSGHIVAAICIAPVILANSGILVERRATVFPTEADTLDRGGAHVQHVGLVVDGNLITGIGPEVARAFGMAIVRALASSAHSHHPPAH